MTSNSISPIISESSQSLISASVVSPTSTCMAACDEATCSTARCALCLHCSQQYCFAHFLQHNEQLSMNAYNFTGAIDQLENHIKNLKLDESLRRTIHCLDQWRKNLFRTIDYVYQEKLASIKANYIQLSQLLQQFQFEHSSQIQTLRVDLEQMKFIRNTYDQDMEKIQNIIKQLQKNVSELRYDLILKERQLPNIYDSIDCEIVWKRAQIDTGDVTISDENIDDERELRNMAVHADDEDSQEDSTSVNVHATSSPTSYEHCLLSFLISNDGHPSTMCKNEQTIQTDTKKIVNLKDSLLSKNKNQLHDARNDGNTNQKKRRTCINCGKCYHPSSLQRHYRQCKRQAAIKQINLPNSLCENLNESRLKTVTNTITLNSNTVS